MAEFIPVIPEKITVHLGASADTTAENVTVDFPDYIKNCASCEIYPTWPDEAVRANIYAVISFAMNRIYTEYYRSRGFDFDITNNTAEDQSFIRGHNYYDTISRTTDEIFNSYIRRAGNVEPLFAAYCNGTTTTCEGLSQWGTVDLANLGYSALRILRFYYGDDIEIVENAPVGEFRPSEPPMPLRIGIADDAVRFVGLRLNRIGNNYPAIPKISNVTYIYTEETEQAVREFQRIFHLDINGTVDQSTWYRIQFIYSGVKRLNELQSEGVTFDEVSMQLPDQLSPGDEGIIVKVVQYYLSVISLFYQSVPPLEITGIYDEATEEAVAAVQALFGLEQTGILDRPTSYAIYDIYVGVADTLADQQVTSASPYPGRLLTVGSSGQDVSELQYYITVISQVYDTVTPPQITGTYDEQTEQAVSELQRIFGITVTGITGPFTWNSIASEYELIADGQSFNDGQYGGNIYETEQ